MINPPGERTSSASFLVFSSGSSTNTKLSIRSQTCSLLCHHVHGSILSLDASQTVEFAAGGTGVLAGCMVIQQRNWIRPGGILMPVAAWIVASCSGYHFAVFKDSLVVRGEATFVNCMLWRERIALHVVHIHAVDLVQFAKMLTSFVLGNMITCSRMWVGYK